LGFPRALTRATMHTPIANVERLAANETRAQLAGRRGGRLAG